MKKRFEDSFDSVFHYTSIESFEKTVESSSMMATEYRYLNDTSELKISKSYFIPFLRELVEPEVRRSRVSKRNEIKVCGGLHRFIDFECDRILNAMHTSAFEEVRGEITFPVFVTSFCGHEAGTYEFDHGLLSMWRAYGRDGIAIEFDGEGLVTGLREESGRFGYSLLSISDVIYQGQDEKIETDYGEIGPDIAELALRATRVRDYEYETKRLRNYLSFSARYKHRAFLEENECRIAAIPEVFPTRDHMRPNKPLSRVNGRRCLFINFRSLPIRRVIVGPGGASEAVYERASAIAQGLGCEVVRSETPYVE